jgi:predicted permease
MVTQPPRWGRWWRPPVDDEVRDELAFHLEMRVRELIAQGRTPDEARAEARRRFGNLQSTSATCRALANERDIAMTRASTIDGLRQDVRFALRHLVRNPGFAATAILTLALGIGATTAIFSVVNAVILRPLPFSDPDRLMTVYSTSPSYARGGISFFDLVTALEPVDSFEAIGAMEYTSANVVDGDTAERVRAAMVTPGFFSVFPMAPLHGRALQPADNAPGQDGVVVISHRLWTRLFAADPAVVGREIWLSGRSRRVVGVMPEAFDPIADGEVLWMPTAYTPEQRQQRDGILLVIARLKPEVTDAQLQNDLRNAAARAVAADARANQERGFVTEPLRETLLGDVPTRLYVWLGAVGFVLLIACGNVANLLLARSASRGGELAVRAALGAGRGRVVRQLVTESLVLAAIAAILGLAVAFGGIQALIQLEPGTIPRLAGTSLDGRTFAFAGTLAIGCALVFGVWPAWSQAASSAPASLHDAGRGSESGRLGERWRTALMTVELAVALVLLAGAGLMIRSALALQRVDIGFVADGLWTGRLALPADGFSEPARVRQVFEDLQAQARLLPGVEQVAVSSQVPMGSGGASLGLLAEGKSPEVQSVVDSRLRIVSPGYLDALRVPLLRGRTFTEADGRGTEKVMVISAGLAEQLFPGEDALGKRIGCCERGPDGQTLDVKVVAGIVGDVRWRGPGEPPAPEFYLPYAQIPDDAWLWIQRTMYLVLRTTPGATVPVGDVQRLIRALVPGVPVFDVRTMEERLARSQAGVRFNTTLLSVLGALGLILAAVGVYGVTAYSVSRRTKEIGVRMALGASRSDVLGLVLRQAGVAIAAGAGLGLAASWGLGRWFASQLFQVSPTDPVALAAAAGVFSLVALAATLLPALRAASVDPTSALRAE